MTLDEIAARVLCGVMDAEIRGDNMDPIITAALARAHAEGLEAGRVAGLLDAAESLEALVRKHTPAATKTIDAMLFILERAIADLRRAAAPGSLIPAAPEVIK